jgi:hypothetical protein
MKKLLFLLSLLILSVSSVKSQVYKIPIKNVNSYTYPTSMSYADAYIKDSLTYHMGMLMDTLTYVIIDLKNDKVVFYSRGLVYYEQTIVGVDMSGLNIVGVSTNFVNKEGKETGFNIILGQFPGSPYYFLQTEEVVGNLKYGHADQEIKPESVEFFK